MTNESLADTSAPFLSATGLNNFANIISEYPYSLIIAGNPANYEYYPNQKEVIASSAVGDNEPGDYGYLIARQAEDLSITFTNYDYQTNKAVASFTVGPSVGQDLQSVNFTTYPPTSAAYKTSFTVAATATSGGAVTFTSSGACSNVGATYTMTSGTGTCTVIATQPGNSTYHSAQDTLNVNATKLAQTITLGSVPTSAADGSSFTVKGTASSGGSVYFNSGGSCTQAPVYSGGSTTPVGATYTMTSGTGTCSVTVSQAGNADYAPAQVTRTVQATE